MDRGQLPNGGAGGSQGNHALQDYQMQLMLLEQQNKKRLLMARQEQDNINHVPGSTPGPGGPFAQNMSPSGSRAGPSPNPNDQMRKIAGTPKMNQNVPGSPAMPGDMQNRGTPPGPGYHEMPGGMRPQMFNANNQAMMGQPPSSHPGFNIQMAGQMNPQNMEQMRMANGGRMPNGQQWPANGQQMMQPGQGPQGQGTPQQRNMTMPPPPAPNPEQQRTQPSSPAQNAAPPTPSQTAKAAPKGKKEPTKKVRHDSLMYCSALTNIPLTAASENCSQERRSRGDTIGEQRPSCNAYAVNADNPNASAILQSKRQKQWTGTTACCATSATWKSHGHILNRAWTGGTLFTV
jgi:hypothetical protein